MLNKVNTHLDGVLSYSHHIHGGCVSSKPSHSQNLFRRAVPAAKPQSCQCTMFALKIGGRGSHLRVWTKGLF